MEIAIVESKPPEYIKIHHRIILQVGVVLTRLVERRNFTPELFQSAVAAAMETATEGKNGKLQRLDTTLDKLRARYGRSVVYFGNVHEAWETAPMRISFTHNRNHPDHWTLHT